MRENMPGVTLIELLVVLAILAIIIAIAYPSYQSYIRSAHRGDAQMTLLKAQLQQSRLHILLPSYSSSALAVGLTDTQYYKFKVVSASRDTYLMQAVAQGTQSKDVACTTMSIDQDSQQLPESCW